MEEKSTPMSRSVSVFIIIITLIAVSVLVPAKWLGGTVSHSKSGLKIDVSSIKTKQDVGTDSDGDGKVSWKEIVSETLEISPQAKEALRSEVVDQKAITELNDPNNLTASFSKNLYLSASYLEKNGLTDEKSQQEMATKLMKEEASKIKPTVYTYNDVKITKTESKESIKAYGNAIEPLLDSIITKKIITEEVLALDTFSKTKDTSVVKPFITNKKALDLVVKKLETMQVPSSALIYHTEMLNKVAAYRDLIGNIATMESDPLRASLVAQNYVTTSRGVIGIFESYSTYFNIQNVTFSKQEPGYVFIIGYTLH